MKTVLIVAAHPDDEILGVGGTVARHVAEGDEVYAVILGEGQTSRSDHREDADQGLVEELHKNTLESAAAIGFREVFFAYFPDNRFDSVDLLDICEDDRADDLQAQAADYLHALQWRPQCRSPVYCAGGAHGGTAGWGVLRGGNLCV